MTRLRSYWWLAAIVVGAVVIALIAGAPPSSKPAFDPTSTAPNGTKALVLLLDQLGAHVDEGSSGEAGTALLLSDRLNAHDRGQLLDWVNAGHTLVVTDPASTLAGVPSDASGLDNLEFAGGAIDLTASCALGLSPAATLRPGGGALLQPGPNQVGCFPAGAGDFLVARTLGAGSVIALGGADPWTNANLAQADNSVLAAVLLAPHPGAGVTLIGSSRVGGGSSGLLSLISPRVKELFWQLVIAFVLVILWKGRRLGRPVPEAQPVELPGSEIVVAAGHLSQEAGHRGRAAGVLRDDLRRRITDRLGIPRQTDDETVAAITTSRTGVSQQAVTDALTGPPPADDGQLVELAQALDAITQEVMHAR
jgi:hypothetical protein